MDQTHMQAPKYDVQFLRSEALCSSSSSSSSSSRTRQIKECKIIISHHTVDSYAGLFSTEVNRLLDVHAPIQSKTFRSGAHRGVE